MIKLSEKICFYLHKWADEVFYAEYASDKVYKNGYAHCGIAVREIGRIHYSMWITNIYKHSNITVGDCLVLITDYILSLLYIPFEHSICKEYKEI